MDIKLFIILLVAIIFLTVVFIGDIRSFLKKKPVKKRYKIEPKILEKLTPEFQIGYLINKERNKLGIHPLLFDIKTSYLAKRRIDEMIENNKLSHELMNDERAELIESGADIVGENIAYGYTNIEALILAFMKSEGHRKNILSQNYNWCGIATKEKYYCILFVGDSEV